ncbi:MAG: sigma-70 family RNA polymerase sigma factor [Planctomycetes bacterium]|jgi:RNA polymerase sigma factor (sigma-70 family)|nr:sigma-70 family RNA polymerase sigma factor [Planctomycetota bacterium]
MDTAQSRDRKTVGEDEPEGRPAGALPLVKVFLRERECLRRIAAGMGLDRADTEDVLQDVSLQVLRQADWSEQDGGMVRWLVRTTVNHCLTEYRRRFRHKASRLVRRRPDLGRSLAHDGGAAEQVGRAEELDIVRRTLLELDPALLLIVVLRYFCDLESKVIAEIVETNASTVRGRLREARLVLARKLAPRNIEP